MCVCPSSDRRDQKEPSWVEEPERKQGEKNREEVEEEDLEEEEEEKEKEKERIFTFGTVITRLFEASIETG
jgi:hypothetical protein